MVMGRSWAKKELDISGNAITWSRHHNRMIDGSHWGI